MPSNKPNTIYGSRLILRAFKGDDIDDVVNLLSNEEIARTYILPDFKSQEEKKKLFEKLMDLSFMVDRFVFGIELSGRIIGFLNDVDIQVGEIELGMVIHPKHKGKGYATEALMIAINNLFDMGYTVVKTAAFEENLASIRVMEKCGMTRLDYTDTLEYRGVVHKCIWYEKRANDIL